ncbi:MAG: hypothetical protein J6V52_05260 [Bacteroidaceae bacterium]|nr:hypothetical protein [Bacteroidaceae bacterium]
MPKLRRNVREAEIADDLRKQYGGMMDVTDMQHELGVKDRRTAERFLDGLTHVTVNRRKKWRVGDVAHRIYQQEGTTCFD